VLLKTVYQGATELGASGNGRSRPESCCSHACSSSVARSMPKLGGLPFFYWYQFMWIGISTVLTAIAYLAMRR